MEYKFQKLNVYFTFKNFAIATIVLFGMSMIPEMKQVLILAAFCVINALFLTYEKYVDLPFDLEFSTFATVLMTASFGLAWGIYTAIFTKMAHILYNRDLNVNSLFTMLGYIIIAIAASIIPIRNIMVLGFIATAIANIYFIIVSKTAIGLPVFETASYVVSNVMFNLILFSSFAGFIFNLMV